MTARTPLRPGDPLPEGWRWVRLGEVCKTKMGGTPSTKVREYWHPPEIVWVTPEDLKKFQLNKVVSSRRSISRFGLEKSSAKLFPKGAILVSTTATIGKVGIAEKPLSANQQITGIVCGTNVVPTFLAYYLLKLGETGLKQLGGTAIATHINQANLRTLPLSLPPLETQRRIVAWLDEAFSHLQAIKERHAEAEREAAALLPAKLAEVFGRAEKEGWRWVKLGEIVKQRRQQVDPSDLNGPLNYIGLEHIEPHTGRLASFEPTKADKLKSAKAVFKKGDLLYGKLRPYLNKVWLAEFDGISSTDIIALIPMANRAMGRFLGYILRSSPILSEVKDRMTGTRMPRIRPQQLLDIGIPLPPLETQRRVVEEIEAFEKEVRKIRETQNKSRRLMAKLEESVLTEAFQPDRWI